MRAGTKEIKTRAQGQWVDLLADVGGLPFAALDGHHHPCPKCGGKDRFRLIDSDAGAVLCSQCFNQKNGDGIAAIRWARDWSFRETIDALSDRLGIQRPGRKPKPEDELEWQDWNAERVDLWGRHRNLGHETVMANGGRLARWRSHTTVVALPISRVRFVVDDSLGEVRTKLRTVGWVIYNVNGKALQRRDGTPAKVLLTTGSQAGWLGTWALEVIQEAKVVWKVEGPTDMLALWQAIPPDWRSSHVVLSNANGAMENPRPELIGTLTDKRVIVVHDADEPGRKGAEKWARGIAQVPGTRVSILDLPKEGTDLRDWLNAGNTYKDLVQLAKDKARDVEALPVVNGRTPSTTAATSHAAHAAHAGSHAGNNGSFPPDGMVNRSMDDPVQLAIDFLRAKAGSVAYHKNQAYTWRDGCWIPISESNLRSDVTIFLVREFARANLELLELAKKTDAPPPQAHKVYNSIVSSTLSCVQAISTVSDDIEWGEEIERNNEDGMLITDTKGARQWVACANGIVKLDDLIEGKPDVLVPHTPNWWSPHKLAFNYDRTAGTDKCPTWMAFLDRMMQGDQERIDTLQEWAGYILVPDTSYHRFLLLQGEGSNGKSVYCNVLIALLGKRNVSAVNLEQFGQRFALTDTLGKLANIVTEIGELDRVAEGVMKQFIAGDLMTFDRKNLPAIQTNPTARLIFATNNPPRITDRTQGVWRRMTLIPWNVEISKDERIQSMDKPEWWQRKGELPAIFNWAVDGLIRLIIQGDFTESEVEKEAKREMQCDSNPAREFLITSVDIAPQNSIPVMVLYKSYREWCDERNYRPLGARMFGKEVHRVFPDIERRRFGGAKREYIYEGISLKTYGELDYA